MKSILEKLTSNRLKGVIVGAGITAVIQSSSASVGMKVNAKRTTVIHLMFNIFGSVLFTVICLITPFVAWMETFTPGNTVAQIANVHTVFNIVTTLILLPFGQRMAAIAVKVLPDNKMEEDEEYCLKYITNFESSYAIGNSVLVIM